jgi:hypothetical protein
MTTIKPAVRAARPLCGVLLAAICAAAGAQAAGPSGKAVLSGYRDGVAGASLMAGDYARVIAELGWRGSLYQSDALSASTNLCIAYVMAREWHKADAMCDEALDVARQEESDLILYTRALRAEHVAVAYSNRAVLHWLESRPEAVAHDLARARALAPDAEFVAQNTAVLGASGSAAVASVVARQR